MQIAHDHVSADPKAVGAIVTSEVLSTLLSKDDFDTAIVFADGATATLIGGPNLPQAFARIHRPLLLSYPDRTGALEIEPRFDSMALDDALSNSKSLSQIRMHGRSVFPKAVRAMTESLTRACETAGISLTELDVIVPHQANRRIIDAVRRRLSIDVESVFENIANVGNTSSSSIPTAIAGLDHGKSRRIGLCAFGGGFTAGATILEQVGG